jgi:Flp pilus assembly protein TadD
MHNIHTFLFLTCIVSLAACSSTSGRYVPVIEQSSSEHPEQDQPVSTTTVERPAAPVAVAPSPPPRAVEQRQPISSPAVIALLDAADREMQSGRRDYAVASIERALNLEPKNAMLWSRLAIIRLQQQDWQQAYVLANKSNSLAQGNRSLQIQNWQVIEKARAGQGDAAGVAEARRMLDSLR